MCFDDLVYLLLNAIHKHRALRGMFSFWEFRCLLFQKHFISIEMQFCTDLTLAALNNVKSNTKWIRCFEIFLFPSISKISIMVSLSLWSIKILKHIVCSSDLIYNLVNISTVLLDCLLLHFVCYCCFITVIISFEMLYLPNGSLQAYQMISINHASHCKRMRFYETKKKKSGL